jgi:hypothetical protein
MLGATQANRRSGAGAQAVSPESKNTDLKTKDRTMFYRFRVCPLGASRNYGYWN